MKKIIPVSVLLSLLLNGCMSIAWIGYKKPTEASFRSVSNNTNCMQIGAQNLTDKQWSAVKEAAADVCEILNSPEFQKRIESRSWLASCEKENGQKDEISGSEVYKLIIKKIPNYSIHPRKPWAAIAQTQRSPEEIVYNRVAINPKRIDGWFTNVDTLKSSLVNTIAHETTHIISEKLMDAGHNTNGCMNSDLVSYSVGDIVEDLWLQKHTKQ